MISIFFKLLLCLYENLFHRDFLFDHVDFPWNTCFLTSKTCFNVKRKRYIFEKQWRFEKCVILVYWAAKGEKEVS